MLQKVKNWWKHEKKSSKVLTVSAAFLIVFSMILIGVVGVSFAASSLPDSLTTGSIFDENNNRVNLFPELTSPEDRIALIPFTGTDSSNNTYIIYCLERTLEWYDDATITKGEQLDAGYAYIVQHGYPTVALTDEGDGVNSYLTQVAIWLYQDRSQGVEDTVDGSLTANQKSAITRSNKYYPIINSLVTGAIEAKENYSNVTPSFSVSSSDFHLDSSMTYLETDAISVSSNVTFNSYTVAVDRSDAQIVNEAGEVLHSTNAIASGEKFKIRIPVAGIDVSDLSVHISVTTDYEMAIAYQYNPPGEYDDMQKSMASAVAIETRSAVASATVMIPTGSLDIEKVDDDGTLLAGADIEVYRVLGEGNEKLIESFTTTGEVKTISNLIPGQYKVIETDAPDGYLLDVSSTSVIINTPGLVNTARLTNKPINIDVSIRKIDKDTKTPLAGAVIKIVDDTGQEVYRFTSEDGYTKIPGLEFGKYQAIEVSAPNGYYLDDTPYDFEITEDNPNVSIDMTNQKNMIQVLKTDEDGNAIKGAVLKVVNVDTGGVIEQWTSSTSPHYLTSLAPGNYRVEEVSPPSGYTLNSNSIPFTVTNTMTDRIEISFPNTKSQITITKVDEQGQVLKGAKLEIYNAAGTKVDEFTSDTTPTVIDGLDIGSYTLREVEAPDGYQLNPIPVSFEITADTENLQVSMTNHKNSISFAKVDSETGNYVSGAKMRLVTADGDLVEEWTSANDVHIIAGLARGTYYFEEVEAPDGYIRNTERIEVVVDKDTTTHTYTMKNQKTGVRIAKVDSETGEIIAGATLELLDENREVLASWTTTADYRSFDDLGEGVYYVRETVAPSGYILNSSLEEFTIDSSNPVATVRFEDEKTTVKVGKLDANTGNYIAGATLRLSRQDSNMEPITFVSEDHATEFRGLATGVYVLEEIEAPSGYITSHSQITFELDSLGKTKNISLKSDLISVSLRDKKLSIDTNGVSGYKFELSDNDGNVLDTYSVDSEIFTSEELELGDYVLKEVEVPDGVVLNSNAYSFSVTEDGNSDIVYFNNDYTKVDFKKQEMIGEKLLEGAHFILRNEAGDVISEWDSTDTAKRIEKLAPGTYTLSEVVAPSGYQLDDAMLTFTVEETSDIQTVTMFNAMIVDVPNTSQNSLLYLFVGTVIIMTGLSIFGYVYVRRNA